MTNPSPAVLCVGHATVDTIYHVPAIPACPTKVLATQVTQVSGGMAANAAAAIARLGGVAHFRGRIGDDMGGAFFLAEMAKAGVDVSGVCTLAGCRTPISAILVDEQGERLVCTHADLTMMDEPSGADSSSTKNSNPKISSSGSADMEPELDMDAFDAVCVDVRWPEAAQRCLRDATQADLPAVLDLDIADDATLAALLPLASYPIFSRPALLACTGCTTPEDALRRVSPQTRGYVGVTLGGDGYLWIEDGAMTSVPAPAVEVVDTLAAGDVFHGAFALALAEGWDTRTAAVFAATAAGLKCARTGGRHGMPTRAEVDAALTDATADQPASGAAR